MEGMIIKALGRFYTVYGECGRINCVLRGKLRQHVNMKRFSDPAAVGDVVDFDINDDNETGVINDIHDRKNVFTRMDSWNKKEDLIAVNLDQIIVIQSFKKPKLNLRFVDRLMVRGEKEHVPVILCLNKVDLASDEDMLFVNSYYRGTDLRVIITSAETGVGLNDLRDTLSNKATILVGSSGVGKSTVLNKLYPDLDLRISAVSQSTGKGRHTTTNVEMFEFDNGVRIIDTPGLREFGLMDIEPQILGNYFYEFHDYVSLCQFQPCTHDHEPGCEIKRQVEAGSISEQRYVSYLHILYSLKDYYNKRYQ